MIHSSAWKTQLRAQLASSTRCSGASGFNAASSCRRSSIVVTPGLPHVAGADRSRLLCDVDGDRAPSDAPSAADATGAAELVDPGRELVGHPLPVARAPAPTYAAPVRVGVLEGEAGIPQPRVLGLSAREVRGVLHGAAEAR